MPRRPPQSKPPRPLVSRPRRTSPNDRERAALAALARIEDRWGPEAHALAVSAAEKRMEGFVRQMGHEASSLATGLFYYADQIHKGLAGDAVNGAALGPPVEALLGKIATLHRFIERTREAVIVARPHFARESLRALVEDARVLAMARVPERAPRVAFIAEVPDLVVHADHPYLAGALAELVCNAAESYPPDAPRMEVTVTGRATRRGRVVELAIADHGRGMTPESVAWTGLPFVTSKRGEAGVGYYIAQRVIERMHDGHVWTESERGKGTTVRLRLPCEQPGVKPRRRPTLEELELQAGLIWERAQRKKLRAEARRAARAAARA